MQITGANDVDIMLDEDGQPVSDGNGDTALVSDDECWLQDIKNEAMTEEGELFYEDEEGDASYGWSLLDFMQGEYDDFTQMEIQQRIRSKMSKRDYIDAGSIQTTVNFDGHIYHIRITKIRRKKMAEASHTTGTVAKITHIALGSGGVNGDGTVIVPLAENVALKKEVVRKPYTSSTKTSDTSYEYTIKLEEDELVGTFISEMALIDEDGDVVAFSNFLAKGKDETEVTFTIEDNY